MTYIDCRDSVLLTRLVLTLSGAIESVRINGVSVESGLNLEKERQKTKSRKTKQAVHNDEVSILSRCP